MWMRVVYLLEVFATLACIHCIYGKKIKWDVKPIALCLSLLVIYEVANNLQNGGLYSLAAYIPIFIYCKRTFGTSILQTLVKVFWLIILLTSIEFLGVLLAIIIIPENLIFRSIFANLFLLIVTIVVLPKIHIERVNLKGRTMRIMFGLVLGIIIFITLQGKIGQNINVILFGLTIPFSLLLVYSLVKWSKIQVEAENIKREFDVASKMEDNYTELLSDIRLKQHGFKNHIAAILSAHYTCKTYERLVEVQEEYCNSLIEENRYNNLLQIGDKVLVGFLYDKFREMEGDNIEVEYEIYSSVDECTITSYYLIEILGILLDNALEAAKCTARKIVIFHIRENDNKYLFTVRNVSEYVPYEEIERWFQKGVSSKGRNRGLGLYYVKRLCRDLNSNIQCRNIEYEQENWIEFSLEVGKADRK